MEPKRFLLLTSCSMSNLISLRASFFLNVLPNAGNCSLIRFQFLAAIFRAEARCCLVKKDSVLIVSPCNAEGLSLSSVNTCSQNSALQGIDRWTTVNIVHLSILWKLSVFHKSEGCVINID